MVDTRNIKFPRIPRSARVSSGSVSHMSYWTSMTSVQETSILSPFSAVFLIIFLIFIDSLLPILLSIFTFSSHMFSHPHHTTPYFCEALLVVSGIEKHIELEEDS